MNRYNYRFLTSRCYTFRELRGLRRHDVRTLPSIVYEATSKYPDMPRIAVVYVNRLRKRRPLQAEPSVKYAMQDFRIRRILHIHVKY